MKTTHLIFDFNGTCFKDTLINYKAWNRSVNSWFGRDYTMNEYLNLNGRTGFNTVEELFRDQNLPKEKLMEYLAVQNRNYLDVCHESRPLLLAPGLKELVLKAREKGITVAICTSATYELMKEFRAMLPVDELFDEKNIICTSGNFPSKPNPAIFRHAIEFLNADAENCIAFEDTKSGLRSAYDAQIKRVVAITGDNLTPLETDVPLLRKAKDFFDTLDLI